MAVRKIRGWWWVDLRWNFIRYRKRSPVNSKMGAEQYEVFLRQQFMEKGSLEHLDTRRSLGPLTFAAFAERWMRDYVAVNNKPSEQRAKRYTLKAHLKPVFGALPLESITTMRVEAFKGRQRERGLHAKTINNHLTILRKCLRTAVEWELLAHLPRIRLLPVALPPVHYLNTDQIERLLAVTPEGFWRTLVLTAMRTGLRIGELLALEWEDIDPANALMTVRRAWGRGHIDTPKNYRARFVPLESEVLTAIARLPHGGPRVFALPVTDPYQFVAKRLRDFYIAAGQTPLGWHALRHTFATELTRNGVHLLATRDLLGHSTTKMTERYAHVAPETLRHAIARLPPLKVWAPGGHSESKSSSEAPLQSSSKAQIFLSN